jgi:hypothetical protein
MTHQEITDYFADMPCGPGLVELNDRGIVVKFPETIRPDGKVFAVHSLHGGYNTLKRLRETAIEVWATYRGVKA